MSRGVREGKTNLRTWMLRAAWATLPGAGHQPGVGMGKRSVTTRRLHPAATGREPGSALANEWPPARGRLRARAGVDESRAPKAKGRGECTAAQEGVLGSLRREPT